MDKAAKAFLYREQIYSPIKRSCAWINLEEKKITLNNILKKWRSDHCTVKEHGLLENVFTEKVTSQLLNPHDGFLLEQSAVNLQKTHIFAT